MTDLSPIVLPVMVVLQVITAAVVGWIFFRQNALIKNYETYASIIDIDKLKKYDEYRRESLLPYMQMKMNEEFKDRWKKDIDKVKQELGVELEERMVQMDTVVWHFLLELPRQHQFEFVEMFLSKSEQYYKHHLRNHWRALDAGIAEAIDDTEQKGS